jgi:glycosyltransferase involved in cell wall biosynthesis
MESPSLGAAIASRNEAELLAGSLAAATGFDEVILFDLESRDDTRTIGESSGARVVSHPAVPFVEMIRERQLDEASTDWVLFLDPDEVLPASWLESVRAHLAMADTGIAGYWVEYQDFAFGRRLEHARRGAAKVALVRRSSVRARESSVVRPHEMLLMDGSVERLPRDVPPIEHHGYRTIQESVDKLARYARHGGVGVEIADSVPGPLTLVKMLWSGVIMTRAWRDGSAGVAASSLSAIGDYLGLLQRWDAEGRPERPIGAVEAASLESARLAHSGQWRVRRSLTALRAGRRPSYERARAREESSATGAAAK